MNRLEVTVIELKDLGKALKKIRRKSGLSMGKLAVKAGLSKGFISEVESGHKTPRIETLRKLGRALNVKIELHF